MLQPDLEESGLWCEAWLCYIMSDIFISRRFGKKKKVYFYYQEA